MDAIDLTDLLRAGKATLSQWVDALIGNITPLIDTMGDSSLFNFACGLAAMHYPGAGGKLTLVVPTKVGGRIEVDWEPQCNTERPSE